MIDIEELKKLALAATKGKWEWAKDNEDNCWLRVADNEEWILCPAWQNDRTADIDARKEEDKSYIAAANPEAILALIEELEMAKRTIHDLENAAITLGRDGDEDI